MKLLPRFRAAAEAAGSEVHEVSGWGAVTDLAARLAGDGGAIVVAPSLIEAHPEVLAALGPRGRVAREDAASVAEAAVGITGGIRLIAETGSVLVSEYALADRLVSMLSRTLVLGVSADALVASLDDAAGWLDGQVARPGYASLVTGPSRTADIERSLTIGVQGPSELHLAVVKEAP